MEDTYVFNNRLAQHDSRQTVIESFDGSGWNTTLYPSIKEKLQDVFLYDQISQYSNASGSVENRRQIVDYLNERSFYKNNTLTSDNIIFTNSVTAAFSYLMKKIVHPNDVVLFTGPSYGLFAFVPERFKAKSMYVPLKEKNGWVIDSEDLDNTIQTINNKLQIEYYYSE